MRFYPDPNYQPDREYWDNLMEQNPMTHLWSMRLRTTINDQKEAVYENDKQVEELIQYYNNDNITDNDIVEADIRLIKFNPNGIGHTIMEHGIYDMEAKKTIWQNPKTHPFE